jgi:hypothetical protein
VLGTAGRIGEAANERLEMNIEELKVEIAKGEDSGRQFGFGLLSISVTRKCRAELLLVAR